MTPATTLHALVSPKNVAVIGASGTPGKLTARPIEFMQRHGFAGTIYPVNPSRSEIMNLKAYPTLKDIPVKIDHAYILLNTDDAIEALQHCADAQVPVVSILADGFAEAGPEGQMRQDKIAKIAKDAGILLIGPNSTGAVTTWSGFSCTTNAAFKTDTIATGKTAVLSQSGSIIGTILSRGSARDAHFSTLVSVGNEAAAGIGEIGEILLDDPNTDGFILFMETIRNRENLTRFALKAREMGKSITAYMVGRSEEGQALSVSHTGALTGSAQAISAFLTGVGINLVENFETLIDAPNAFAKTRLPAGRPKTVTVVSTTGGGGAMVLDQISALGVDIAECSPESRAKLTQKNIPLGHGKLVDVTLAGTKYETMHEVISTLSKDPETGVLLVVIGSSAQFNPELAVKPIVDAVAAGDSTDAPVICIPMPDAPQSIAMLEAGGIPTFRSVEICAEAVALLLKDTAVQDDTKAAFPEKAATLMNAEQCGIIDEYVAGQIFASLGATGPRQIHIKPDETLPAEIGLAWPVVVKVVSPDIPHKTEADTIEIGIKDRATLEKEITTLYENADLYRPAYRNNGILIQEMCSGIGEALIGLTRDPLTGPMLTIGMGGVATEIYRDTSVRCAPVSVKVAQDMISEVRGFELLNGFRGRTKGDLKALAELASNLSRLALIDDVEEAEINPVLIHEEGEGVTMLDALMRKNNS